MVVFSKRGRCSHRYACHEMVPDGWRRPSNRRWLTNQNSVTEHVSHKNGSFFNIWKTRSHFDNQSPSYPWLATFQAYRWVGSRQLDKPTRQHRHLICSFDHIHSTFVDLAAPLLFLHHVPYGPHVVSPNSEFSTFCWTNSKFVRSHLCKKAKGMSHKKMARKLLWQAQSRRRDYLIFPTYEI